MLLRRDPDHPDWLVTRESSRAMPRVWLVLAIACAVVAGLAIGDVEIAGRRVAGPGEAIVMTLLTLIFGALAGRRSRTRLHPATGELVTLRRFFHWSSETTRSVGTPEVIKVGRDRRGQGSSSRTVYPVILYGAGGREEISADYGQGHARATARDLSTLLGVPWEDKSEYEP